MSVARIRAARVRVTVSLRYETPDDARRARGGVATTSFRGEEGHVRVVGVRVERRAWPILTANPHTTHSDVRYCDY
jgi:hypothetical protein